jgi:hypothetical protein
MEISIVWRCCVWNGRGNGETETPGKWMMMMMMTTIAVENESSDMKDERVPQTKRMSVLQTELYNVEARKSSVNAQK